MYRRRITDEDNEGIRSLRTYLRDHLAGAVDATQLFKALGEQHAGNLLGHFAAALLVEIEQDMRTLASLAKQAEADGFQVKEIAGWLGES